MPSFDLLAAAERARKIIRKRKVLGLRAALLGITAHAGSVATILGIWFMRGGMFQFRSGEWIDWLLLIVLLLIAYSGIRTILGNLSAPREIVVRRSELVDLIAAARFNADSQVLNLAGDLSWLSEDFEISRAIREAKPTLGMSIYYDRSRTSRDLLPLFKQYDDLRIRLVPYPEGVSPSLRCMLVDFDSPDGRRLYVYSRVRSGSLERRREDQEFSWEEIGPESTTSINAVKTLLNIFQVMPRTPILVGFSGANNVGKTSIVRRTRELLDDHLSVRVFGDEFRMAARGTTLEDAYATLASQLTRISQVRSDVCIFDRTFADNLCFIRLREGQDERVYRVLAPQIAEVIKHFDLVVDVRRSKEDFDLATTYLTGPDRRRIRLYLDEFFANSDIKTMKIATDGADFERSVEEAANSIAIAIRNLYKVRNVG